MEKSANFNQPGGVFMNKSEFKCQSVDEYIAGFPKNIQEKLKSIRMIIKKAAPDALETISYQMPAYKLNGILLYFAGYKNHIGFYPLASAIKTFKSKIESYSYSKGSIQFPIDEKLPKDLIEEIAKYRVAENAEKVSKNRKTKPSERKK
jgi:uncharacterized protein YdhG (YjbR/CyaY superfamily)